MKFISILFVFLFPFFANSQSPVFYIYNENYNPIKFASILNENTKIYTYSNESGVFRIEVNEGDTLILSHVNYETLRLNGISRDGMRDTLFLKEKANYLDEVIVRPTKRESFQFGNITKKESQYALTLNTSYAFEIEIPKKLNGYLSSVEIPINSKRRYSNEGFLVIQLYRIFDQDYGFKEPIGSIKYFEIEDLKKENSIEFHVGVELEKDLENLFLYVNRIVPDKVFDERDEKLSVNPLFYYKNNNSDLNGFMNYVLFDGWYSLEKWFENVPIIDIRLNIESTE